MTSAWLGRSSRATDRTTRTRRPRDLDVGGLLTTDLRRPDPASRLGSIGIEPEELHLTDLGIESDGGTTARHLRLAGVETDVSGARVPTTFDLWVDGDLHLVRAEFSRLDSLPGRYAASFTYGVPTVSRDPPPATADCSPSSRPRRLCRSTTDPVGDVDISRPKSWFVPSLDITTFQTTYEAASRTMQFRIGFADLLELKHRHARFEQRITISNSRTSGQFYFERTVRGDSVLESSRSLTCPTTARGMTRVWGSHLHRRHERRHRAALGPHQLRPVVRTCGAVLRHVERHQGPPPHRSRPAVHRPSGGDPLTR